MTRPNTSRIPFFAASFFLSISLLLSASNTITTASGELQQPNNNHRHLRNNGNNSPKYTVKACLVDGIGKPCSGNASLEAVSDLRVTQQNAENSCEETEGQRGSVTYADLVLPTLSSPNQVLMVEVTTKVQGQDSTKGFFVRPTRLTRYWGKPTVSSKTASFYLAETGQFSVEFASDSTWRNKQDVTTFDALMLFVNPEINIPETNVITVNPNSNEVSEDLGPNKNYVFKAGIDYDWGKDHVFKVHDNTNVYFEKGAYVRARIVQTERKVKNVVLKGYGTLDVHYNLEPDVIGISDDATRQNVGIYGKNIQVMGLTLLNTNPTCGLFGYCLNINANWSPLPKDNEPFDVFELQNGNPPYSFQQAHCQENNMDDSPNTDFTNCPTSHEDGQHVSYVKCMTWQLGHDGLNAGKWGTIEKSFVRTVDDAIKPWDSHGIYKDITIWQLTLGWPINFGWWNWNQPDIGTTVDSIYVIHNHNWVTSPGWPETESGQCVVGGIYGSGAVKKGYRLSNIFVETAVSCAIGLDISNDAYSKHLTPEGCVGNIIDTKIEGMYFDEEFYQTGGYSNYLSGEKGPKPGCTGDLAGKIENMVVSGSVAGRPLSLSDFVVDGSTVAGLKFENPPSDPHPSAPHYQKYENSNAYAGQGAGAEIDSGVEVISFTQCLDRCQSDWSCDCVVYSPSESMCWKRKDCQPSGFDSDAEYDVYMRKWEETPVLPTPIPTAMATSSPSADPQASPTASPLSPPTTIPSLVPPSTTAAPQASPSTSPLPVPSPPPSPPSSNKCSDDLDLGFQNKARKNCSWVSKKPVKRCGKNWNGKKLRDYCKESCGVCENGDDDDDDDDDYDCTDDASFRFRNKNRMDCRWVGRKRSKRCNKIWQGQKLKEYCPASCNTC
eukprot:CAMPEP_0201119460 /NCGR_PEP_ID=MMETSP0850-20130426/3605_1 /ASSEMBLY_ACC=CAM_ASM_000622 /TAXON_ID=183588 /ORGANISM="Pseudo-nitzschia fraudulenta, Strain WWA7" /LENGTH=888 /DNA_ID=CAMNT_0047385179 /DNA_START=22 /DNA_END=2688 /DNA_ORIENTATION=-